MQVLFLCIGTGVCLLFLVTGVSLLTRKVRFMYGALFVVALCFVLGLLWLKEDKGATAIAAQSSQHWDMKVYAGESEYPAAMNFEVIGSQFEGTGADSLGKFIVHGKFEGSERILFNKLYDRVAKNKGATREVVTFFGKRKVTEDGVRWTGAYTSRKKVGYEHSILNPLRYVPVNGKWTAAPRSSHHVSHAARSCLKHPLVK